MTLVVPSWDKATKTRAQRYIQRLVRRGQMPRAKTRRCVDCGGPAAVWDHYLGYDHQNWGMVQAVCAPCDGRRRADMLAFGITTYRAATLFHQLYPDRIRGK